MQPRLRRRYEALEAGRERLFALLAGADAGAVDRRPAPGRWSPGQVAHHVLTSEALTLGYVRKKAQGGASLPRAGLVSRVRLLALRLALASPLRIQAPPATAAVPETTDLAALRRRWDDVRNDLCDLLERFPAEAADRVVFRHPVVGLLGIEDTLGFLQAHLDHHAKQVEAALRS